MNDTARQILEGSLNREREWLESRLRGLASTMEHLAEQNEAIDVAKKRIADLEATLAQPERAVEGKRLLPADATPGVFIGYEADKAGVWIIKWSAVGWYGRGQQKASHPSGYTEATLYNEHLEAILVSCEPLLE